MNAQSIWAGEVYAYATYRPNQTFVMNANKIRAKKVEKKRQYGNERLTAFVIGDRLDAETDQVIQADIQVRARDVIDFWDSYSTEREAIRQERAERTRLQEEAWERQRQEREAKIREETALREAKERAESEAKEKLVSRLIEKTGIPRDAIYSIGHGTIQLDRTMMELWLSNGEAHVPRDQP